MSMFYRKICPLVITLSSFSPLSFGTDNWESSIIGLNKKGDIPIIRERKETHQTTGLPVFSGTKSDPIVIESDTTSSLDIALTCESTKDARELAMITKTSLYNFNSDQSQIDRCYSNAEQLHFSAIKASENLLGPHVAPWYHNIQKKNRKKAYRQCKTNISGNSKSKSEFTKCFQNKIHVLMEPHEKRLQNEEYAYIEKRRTTAEQLLQQCHIAVNNLQTKFPKSLRLPLNRYTNQSNSLPTAFLDDLLSDSDELIQSKGKVKYSTLLRNILGKACPGDMINWISYPEKQKS